MRLLQGCLLALLLSLLAACGTSVPRSTAVMGTIPHATRTSTAEGSEVVLYAMGLIGTGYRFGGKNPAAGLDCSGMVSYIYREATGRAVTGSAADIAGQGREIDRMELRPGDLVFFNTRSKSFSHVGIYIGDARFIHAPSSNGRVRIDRLDDRYYALRYEAARTFFE